MIKKTITYTDYDGNERTEDFWFHLSKAELLELNYSLEGGLEIFLEKIISSSNTREIVAMFKKIILMAYGEKSFDGRRFVKSEDATLQFTQTEAYSQLFVEILSDPDKATELIKGMIPSQE